MTVAELLAGAEVFAGCDRGTLVSTALLWRTRRVPAGSDLWRHGDAADELAIIVEGDVSILYAGQPVSEVHAGDLVGEGSAFFQGQRRLTTVRAVTATIALSLPDRGLATLRLGYAPVYDALLCKAVASLAQRVSNIDARIARLSQGQLPAPRRTTSGAIQRIWTRLSGGSAPGAPPVSPALSLLPALRDAPPEVLAPIAGAMSPQFVEPGRALFLEGDPGDAMFVLAEGRIEVLRNTDDGAALELASLGVGSLIGTGAALPGNTRNASCVAPDGAWVWMMTRDDMDSLAPAPKRGWCEALLTALRSQLLGADEVMAQLVALGARESRGSVPGAEPSFDQLLLAAGWSTAYRAPEADAGIVVPSVLMRTPEVELGGDEERLLEYIRTSIVGGDEAIDTPFGLRRIVYADYTASGRCLSFVEDYVREEVMPLYANTHTEASGTGRATTRVREEARAIIKASVGGTDEDSVIFCGSGATGAIARLIAMLNLLIPHDLDVEHGLSKHIPAERRPVVFVGPYEHHSNELTWRHTICDVVVIDEDDDGRIDLSHLERELVTHAERPLKIGSFSAASNVTGIVSDTRSVAVLLHQHGALSFWDFAAAGPYVQIEMNRRDDEPGGDLAYKDAVFLSPHKFIGGPGTPGVLVLKKALANNTIPGIPGGGSVAFVGPDRSTFVADPEVREEAGTPAILESIKCGVVFKLKDTVGADAIGRLEDSFLRRAIATWRRTPNIRVLGNPNAHRLSIVSFMIRHGARFLHFNYVVSLLNDLFGIQARGGCSCAGPYGHRLLGVSRELSGQFECRLADGWEILRPGWGRVNFNYFISDREFTYIVAAVELVALYGWLLLPDYRYDPRNGMWTHVDGAPLATRGLSQLSFDGGRMSYPSRHARLPEDVLASHMEDAVRILREARTRRPDPDLADPELPEHIEDLRWFVTPGEIARKLSGLTIT